MTPKTPEERLVQKRNLDQIDRALSPFNRWVAGVNLGHKPDTTECVLWYIDHGGPEDYNKEHPRMEDVK